MRRKSVVHVCFASHGFCVILQSARPLQKILLVQVMGHKKWQPVCYQWKRPRHRRGRFSRDVTKALRELRFMPSCIVWPLLG